MNNPTKLRKMNLQSSREDWIDSITITRGQYFKDNQSSFQIGEKPTDARDQNVVISYRRKDKLLGVCVFESPVREAFVRGMNQYALGIIEKRRANRRGEEYQLIDEKNAGMCPMDEEYRACWRRGQEPNEDRVGLPEVCITLIEESGQRYLKSVKWNDELAIHPRNQKQLLDSMTYKAMAGDMFALLTAITDKIAWKKIRERFNTYIRTQSYTIIPRDGFEILRYILNVGLKRGFSDVDAVFNKWESVVEDMKISDMPGDLFTRLQEMWSFLDVNGEKISQRQFYRKYCAVITNCGYFPSMRASFLSEIVGKPALPVEAMRVFADDWDTKIEAQEIKPQRHEFITVAKEPRMCLVCQSETHLVKFCPLNPLSEKADKAKINAVLTSKATIAALRAGNATKKAITAAANVAGVTGSPQPNAMVRSPGLSRFEQAKARSGCKKKKCLRIKQHDDCALECGICLVEGKSLEQSKACNGASDGHEYGGSVAQIKKAAKLGKISREYLLTKFRNLGWITDWCETNSIAALADFEFPQSELTCDDSVQQAINDYEGLATEYSALGVSDDG